MDGCVLHGLPGDFYKVVARLNQLYLPTLLRGRRLLFLQFPCQCWLTDSGWAGCVERWMDACHGYDKHACLFLPLSSRRRRGILFLVLGGFLDHKWETGVARSAMRNSSVNGVLVGVIESAVQ